MNSRKIKELVRKAGADLCGIAPAERFAKAPEGFRPTDVFSRCASVIFFARRVPRTAMYAESCVPYTYVNDAVNREVDRMGIEIALAPEDSGFAAVPVPSADPYEHWEPERSYGRAILSMRHAGMLAGLGVMGRNNLLINETYGSMIQIGAVLTDRELEYDPVAEYNVCPPGCNVCIESCPRNALDGITVNQERCRELSTYRTGKGYVLKKCNICRRVCPGSCGLRQRRGVS